MSFGRSLATSESGGSLVGTVAILDLVVSDWFWQIVCQLDHPVLAAN